MPNIMAQYVTPDTGVHALYTVPAGAACFIFGMNVNNQNGADGTWSVAVAKAGAADSPEQYLETNRALASHVSEKYAIGLHLNPGDVIRVKSSAAGFGFTLLC